MNQQSESWTCNEEINYYSILRNIVVLALYTISYDKIVI